LKNCEFKLEVFNMNDHMKVATSTECEFRDPTKDKPPEGTKLSILTVGGVLVHGVWRDNAGYVAWAPVPKMPVWLKEKLSTLQQELACQRMENVL
jgi:hypothetical protein